MWSVKSASKPKSSTVKSPAIRRRTYARVFAIWSSTSAGSMPAAVAATRRVEMATLRISSTPGTTWVEAVAAA